MWVACWLLAPHMQAAPALLCGWWRSSRLTAWAMGPQRARAVSQSTVPYSRVRSYVGLPSPELAAGRMRFWGSG